MNEVNGNELAKVLWYYNQLNDLSELQKIVCPFHEDKNPSMLIDLGKGSFYCFGCNESGNAVKFVRLMEQKFGKCNDLQAQKKFAKILKSKECSNITVRHDQKRYNETSKQLYDEACDYYYGLSKVNWRSSDDPDVKAVKSYMLKRGFTSKALSAAGAKITYTRNYPIIFPMMDNGKFKGWVCRTTSKEVEAKRKYLYNKGFSRANTLVGDYGSKPFVFVVEGYMDRLKFVQFGENNVVALLGWRATANQIEKLKQAGVEWIICATDNDKYGKKGYAFLQKFFKVVRFCYLKGIKDPGDMNEELFRKMYNKTMKKFNALGGKRNGIT